MAERITKERLKWIADHPHAVDVLASEASDLAFEILAYRESGALAGSIADALFTNGEGEKAERLVLELADKRDGGGWCRKAVEDVIKHELEAIGE